ncbi:hypothetical protein A2757_01715 [Candidatus Giovannonibacteria bacterium RIFCSPHIGHO2_01_FULL_48_47]|nr:MAG: hypothetical protein A2757_01715 [Candidatus Giovannonibacteria bacterium RIFCSPHIGHO2_01_FULL_48_47]OGF68420.1 MAG: hypothetical protein A3D61_00910 [Candidatus Giovannonibacteria bacterium RIFCSPHIGHO2_02_FULL_48_15]OGF88756.1 MAG: hypothetical protein A3B26_03000 [Candidatus Giovannonibacteria bacterium RIFCSPLOWO2_01_FULL_48_47]OGF94469.1 MAG: hypothetical protein A2433_00105 [Candidatus Giovannonibacteria bacterium RIFOXYC1_FULL_48_8]OGF96123.1 MAG: hypothetical protein A2613_00955
MKIKLERLTFLTTLSLFLSVPFLFYLLSYPLAYLSNSGGEIGISIFFLFIPTVLSSPLALAFGVIAFRRAYKNPNTSRSEYIFSAVGALFGLIAAGYIILFLLSGIL